MMICKALIIPHSFSMDPPMSKETKKLPVVKPLSVSPAESVVLEMLSAYCSSMMIGGVILFTSGLPPSKASSVNFSPSGVLKSSNVLMANLNSSFPVADTAYGCRNSAFKVMPVSVWLVTTISN